MIEGDSEPLSMGVIPVGETIQVWLTQEQRARLAACPNVMWFPGRVPHATDNCDV